MIRVLTSMFVATLMLAGGVPAAAAAIPAAPPGTLAANASAESVDRIWGANRYATAEEVSKNWSGPLDVLYVVSGRNYPDALAAAARAGRDSAPVLLTDTNAIPAETDRALRRLSPQRIVVVGGSTVVSTTVVQRLGSYAGSGKATRIAGANRYQTGAALAQDYAPGLRRVYLTNGDDFPNALVTAPLAGSQNVPLLLTSPTRLDSNVAAQLRRLAPREIVVVGGTSSVSSATATKAASYAVNKTPIRVSGSHRYENAALIADRFPDSASTAFIASGASYPDALVGAALAAREGGPVLLSPQSALHASTKSALSSQRPDRIRLFGGSSALGNTVMSGAKAPYAALPVPPTGSDCADPLPSGTTFGASLNQVELSVPDSIQDADSTFGRLPIVRHFSPTLPKAWNTSPMADLKGRALITSFKAPPSEILAGKHDAALRTWFATAPADQTIYWSYFHEPEPEIRDGHFTAAQYRAAWRRISGIAAEACRPNMHPTLILMGWTANPQSGRTISDYDPGKEYAKVIAFDVYNAMSNPKQDHYSSPQRMYDYMLDYMEKDGRPFGLAETGTRLIPGDNGSE
ncbi:MAG: cell wall-binding repeat-containing protein, partial [Ornithinimicrobium sp.]